jgi:hypothetical protein
MSNQEGVWREVSEEEGEVVRAWGRPVVPVHRGGALMPVKALVLESDYCAIIVARNCRDDKTTEEEKK